MQLQEFLTYTGIILVGILSVLAALMPYYVYRIHLNICKITNQLKDIKNNVSRT